MSSMLKNEKQTHYGNSSHKKETDVYNNIG